MKIGILSLTSGYNFGGTLQTVALFRALERIGHDPVVIDYWPVEPRSTPIWRGWGLRQSKPIEGVRRRIGELHHSGPFLRGYSAFKRRHLRWTARCMDRGDFREELRCLDAVVVGSDQVWNLRYHPDPIFMLDGFEEFQGLRVAYAACCGNPKQDFAPWAPRALSTFDYIGVRNRFTADWVRRCTGGRIIPEVVCDPTLLIDDYPRCNLDLPDRYIAAYHIGEAAPDAQQHMIRVLRERHGDLPVVCLMGTGTRIQIAGWHDITFWRLDPFEWVEAIRGATAVFTDSYHAILFALRYQIPLLATYTEEVRAPRLIELRESFDLGESIVRADTRIRPGAAPDLAMASARLLECRSGSLAFLEKSLRHKVA